LVLPIICLLNFSIREDKEFQNIAGSHGQNDLVLSSFIGVDQGVKFYSPDVFEKLDGL
jgi:hypothetical protein